MSMPGYVCSCGNLHRDQDGGILGTREFGLAQDSSCDPTGRGTLSLSLGLKPGQPDRSTDGARAKASPRQHDASSRWREGILPRYLAPSPNELTPSHSITSSALTTSDDVIVRPISFAVFRLMASASFMG